MILKINPEDIEEAESILLQQGETFDLDERVPFIQNLETCDLLAVPGSGKTTALLAKLICLETKLPFADGSGILVLAHTNAAVDEIREKIHHISPKLFDFPNFVGTIQSFVNQFLAIPFAKSHLGFPLSIFDEERFGREVSKEFWKNPWNKEFDFPIARFMQMFQERAIRASVNFGASNKSADELESLLASLFRKRAFSKDIILELNKTAKSPKLKVLNQDVFDKQIKHSVDEYLSSISISYSRRKIFNTEGADAFVADWNKATNRRWLGVKQAIEIVLAKGITSFQQAYSFADDYVTFYPEVLNVLRNRFRFVFVDEAQDLNSIQLEIIDKIFNAGKSSTKVQRIGDKNQSIYGSGAKVKVHCDWITRGEEKRSKIKDLMISGSNRLTEEVATIVDCLVLDRKPEKYKVIGLRTLPKPIKPRLIVYSLENCTKVVERFGEIINGMQESGDIPKNPKHPFKVVAWSAVWNVERTSPDKLRLENFVPYSKEEKSKREYHDSLAKYFHFYDRKDKTMRAITQSLKCGICEAMNLQGLRKKGVINGKDISKMYSVADLEQSLEELEQNFNGVSSRFRQVLFDCGILTIREEAQVAYSLLARFILEEFSSWFGFEANGLVREFIGEWKSYPIAIEPEVSCLPIEVGTIHSAKGQTHCATLYIETVFHSFETEKIVAPLYKEAHGLVLGPRKSKKPEAEVRKKEALKMLYVGFSRPTHLLCFAVLETNVKGTLQKFHDAGWEIDTELSERNFKPEPEL
jgi:DNA helicase-2/ATP-dependent DNA helicase PcrA